MLNRVFPLLSSVKERILPARKQHGQAMVEYAILLILLVMVVMGGAELGITAYHASKTGDGAKAAANEWAEAIGFSKALYIESNDLSDSVFEDLLEGERQALNIDTDEILGSFDDETVDQVRPSLDVTCVGDIGYTPPIANFVDLPIDITKCDPVVRMNSSYNPEIDPDSDPATLNGIQALVDTLYPPPDFRVLDINIDFFTACTRNDASTGNIEKIVECKTVRNDIFDTDAVPIDGIEDTCATPPTLPSTTCPNELDDDDPTYRKLLILKSLKNSVIFKKTTSSVQPAIRVGDRLRIGLGDHSNSTLFRQPSCNVTLNGTSADYDNGLPDDDKIYLFNPLPIDITDCKNDGNRGNKGGAGILVGGYANTNSPALNVEGLPQLNQALYSQYTKVCVNVEDDKITIQPLADCVAAGSTFRLWMKPPGKMCGASGGGEVCPHEPDGLNGATGFYFFGDSNESGENLEYIPTTADAPQFRPTFQLVCGDADYKSSDFDANGECNNLITTGAGSFALQVHTRYRSIFESFLTFGLQEIPAEHLDILPYFYNPNKVGESNQLVGTAGSEIGPIGANKNPTVKRFKDFRGCYQVDITPPDKLGDQVKTTVSSCN